MSIPFRQYLLANGRQRDEEIDRPEEVEAIARRFIESGGRYECEVLTTGHVSLTAVKYVPDVGEEMDVEIIVCDNGPCIPERVDELVRKSEAHILKA